MKDERIIRGVMASPGVAIGRAIRTFDPLLISYNFHIPQSETAKEVARFRASVEKSRKQLVRMQAELRQSTIAESSFLVDAHLLILQDKLFVDRIIETIQERAVNAEWAIQQVSDEL
jgi:phosphotransferase system enzyme I (PtsI)